MQNSNNEYEELTFENKIPEEESKRNSLAFSLLSPGIQHWVAKQGWNGFRNIQSNAIISMLAEKTPPSGMIISAGTSMGKTEAAFMPSLSYIQNYTDEHRNDNFVYLLYVAPLKALINDQHRRMIDMSSHIGIPAYLWHGDAAAGQKQKLMSEHTGILMTTPESLESFLMNRGKWCAKHLTPLVVIVDEFHAFLGEGRGKQLLSLLSRIDSLCLIANRPRPIRIGLSATLSKLDLVANLLVPQKNGIIIDGSAEGKNETQIEIATYLPPIANEGVKANKVDYSSIANDIIHQSVGHKTLTFCKSRLDVETMSAEINEICQRNNYELSAFPHHGSLSKETREELENRLVNTDKPTIAVATVTLELGIDIGDIYKVFQVGNTNSVASLRQRVGRSGRRDGIRRLEMMLTLSGPQNMEQELTTGIAEIELMERGWFEPPNALRKDVSVLVSEIISVLKQYTSAYQDELYTLLCRMGAFNNIDEELFGQIIDDMIMSEFIEVCEDDTLILGKRGEQEIGDWHFYATFQTEESYTVRHNKKVIGEITPPATAFQSLEHGGMFMLAGKYWQCLPPIDYKNRVISVKPVNQKSQYLLPTSKGGGDVCGYIKRKRISLLTGKDREIIPDYLDEYAIEALEEAREYAKEHHLNGLGLSIYDTGEAGSESPEEVLRRIRGAYGTEDAVVRCVPPIDTAAVNALEKMLENAGMYPGGLENIPLYRLAELVEICLAKRDLIYQKKDSLIDEAMINELAMSEKYNMFLSRETLRRAYADEILDLDGAFRWMEAFERFWENGRFEK